MLQIFPEGHILTACLLDMRETRKDLKCRTKTRKNRISTDDTLFCQSRHPFMDFLRQLIKNRTPVSTLIVG